MPRIVLAICAIVFAVAIASCAPPPCGGSGQNCCEMGASCSSGLACRGGGCQPSHCVQCGALGQTCCDTGSACSSGVCSGGSCVHCGLPGEVCCGNACQSGAVCAANGVFSPSSCVACGRANEPCCSGSCESPLQCQPTTTAGDGTCVACGGEGEVCCAGNTCHDRLPCNANGTCGLCGTPGLACCPGLRCNAPAECFSTGGVATCANCGGRGEPCCGGVGCDSASLFCSGGTCQPCGDLGDPCCAGSVCPTEGECIAGVCRTGPGDAGGMSTPCTAMSCPTNETCLPYPAAVCTRPCSRDADCGADRACADGICLPSCTPGRMDCDRFGGACYSGVAPYTSLDAPAITGTPRCFASCFAASATLPPAYPACSSGTSCDPASGLCTAGTAGHVAVGAPCTDASDCAGVCLQSLEGGVPTGFVGGYCVALARNPEPSSVVAGGPLPTSNCPPGAVAIPAPASGNGDIVACYAACTTDCDCRVGYACEHDPLRLGTASPNGACLPVDCAIEPDACPTGSVCYRAGPFSHRLHPVCGPASVSSGDAGLDGGYDPYAIRSGCDLDAGATDGDAGLDAALDAMDAATE